MKWSWPFRKKSIEIINTPDQLAGVLDDYLSAYASQTGRTVTKDTAMRVATVFACVRVLSESVGMLPCKLFERVGDRRKVAENHDIHHVLSTAPNHYMTPQEFWELLIACLCLSGNFYALKTKVRGEVRELLPLEPSSVKVELTNRWEPVYQVTMSDGTIRSYSQTDIFHVRLLTKDGLNGLSPIRYSAEAIGISLASQDQAARWYANGVAPSGVLSTDQGLTEQSFNRLQQQFKSKSVNSSSAHAPLILEHGLKWLSTSLNAQDLQFLDTRKFQRDEICAIFRVPPHLVANMEKATFSNIEHQGLSFVNYSLVPYLTRIEQRGRLSLLKPSDQKTHFIKFNTGALLRGDTKSRYESYGSALQNGWLSRNEVRAWEDLDPIEGGDEYLTPLNMTNNPAGSGQNDQSIHSNERDNTLENENA